MSPPPVEVNSDPDYQVLAELRGNFDEDFYKIQIQFVDFHTGEVLYNGLYRIRKEQQAPPPAPDATRSPLRHTRYRDSGRGASPAAATAINPPGCLSCAYFPFALPSQEESRRRH